PPLEAVDYDTFSTPIFATWEKKMASQRRRRRFSLALAAVLVIGASLFLLRPVLSPPIATVLAYAGPDSSRYGVNKTIMAGTLLETSGQPEERLAVALGDHIVRLDAGTELRLDDDRRIELRGGAIYLETAPSPLVVIAGDSAIEHIGTRYEVRLQSGELDVRVRAGRVKISNGGRSIEVEPGQGASNVDGGRFSIRDIRRTGESWTWLQQAAPPFESDGAALEAVLTWLAAEAGWELEIDPGLYQDATGEPAKVRGSIRSLSPEAALAQVLTSAGLSYRFDGDRLIVEEPE
ncbi:MAG: FecR domain-containing protein, partial [Planctomycetota bacterium]